MENGTNKVEIVKGSAQLSEDLRSALPDNKYAGVSVYSSHRVYITCTHRVIIGFLFIYVYSQQAQEQNTWFQAFLASTSRTERTAIPAIVFCCR